MHPPVGDRDTSTHLDLPQSPGASFEPRLRSPAPSLETTPIRDRSDDLAADGSPVGIHASVVAAPATPAAIPFGVVSGWQPTPRADLDTERTATTASHVSGPNWDESPAKNEPLDDVLLWLGQSDLGKDRRFLPVVGEDQEDDFDHMMYPEEPVALDARELFSDVAEEGLARVQAPNAGPHRTREPKHRRHLETPGDCEKHAPLCHMLGQSHAKEETLDPIEEEEAEWTQRRVKTGAVGRLVVYAEGDDLQNDFVLRGGINSPFVVATLREAGCAARAGVKAGDRLVSINGKKDFIGLSAEGVREYLQTPAMVVFLGFVGKLHAEVRLTSADRVCGLPMRHDVARGYSDAPLQLYEERVFDAGIASLFLAVADEQGDEGLDGLDVTPMFELRRSEAYTLLRGAMRTAPRAGRSRRTDSANHPKKASGDHGASMHEDDPAVAASRLAANASRSGMLNPRAVLVSPRDEGADIANELSRNASPRTSARGVKLEGPRAAGKSAPCLEPESCEDPFV